jgi:hypothetical protein
MRVRTILLCAALLGCGGGAKSGAGKTTGVPAPRQLDLGPWKPQMTVFSDGGRHVVATVIPDPERAEDPDPALQLFYGDGKRMESQNAVRYDATGMKFEVGFDDPGRGYSPAGYLKREQGIVTLSCGGKEARLTALPAGSAQAILSDAQFVANRNQRRPHTLARDPEGTTYYVDVAFIGETKGSHRLLAGKGDKLAEVAITYVDRDRDYAWIEFQTAKGRLRVEYRRGGEIGATWKTAKGETELKAVGRDELWVEAGKLGLVAKDTGTPCAALTE